MDVAASQGTGQDDVAARRGVRYVVVDADVLTAKILRVQKILKVLINMKKMMSFELKGKAISS